MAHGKILHTKLYVLISTEGNYMYKYNIILELFNAKLESYWTSPLLTQINYFKNKRKGCFPLVTVPNPIMGTKIIIPNGRKDSTSLKNWLYFCIPYQIMNDFFLSVWKKSHGKVWFTKWMNTYLKNPYAPLEFLQFFFIAIRNMIYCFLYLEIMLWEKETKASGQKYQCILNTMAVLCTIDK